MDRYQQSLAATSAPDGPLPSPAAPAAQQLSPALPPSAGASTPAASGFRMRIVVSTGPRQPLPPPNPLAGLPAHLFQAMPASLTASWQLLKAAAGALTAPAGAGRGRRGGADLAGALAGALALVQHVMQGCRVVGSCAGDHRQPLVEVGAAAVGLHTACQQAGSAVPATAEGRCIADAAGGWVGGWVGATLASLPMPRCSHPDAHSPSNAISLPPSLPPSQTHHYQTARLPAYALRRPPGFASSLQAAQRVRAWSWQPPPLIWSPRLCPP